MPIPNDVEGATLSFLQKSKGKHYYRIGEIAIGIGVEPSSVPDVFLMLDVSLKRLVSEGLVEVKVDNGIHHYRAR